MQNSLPNIAVVIPTDTLRNYPYGGGLTYIRNFCELYDGNIIIIDATTNKIELYKERKLTFYNKQITSIPFLYLKKNSKIPIRLKSFIGFLFTKKIYNVLKKYPILYVQMPECLFGFIYRKKRKIIFHLHGCDSPLKFSRYKFFRKKIFQYLYENLIVKRIVKRVDLLVTVNDDCEKFIEKFKKRARTEKIENLINPNVFKPIERNECRIRKNINTESTIYLMVCRIEEVKGIDHIIKVFKRLIEMDSNKILMIAGEGTMIKYYRAKVESMGIGNNIIFLGTINYDELKYYYNAADFYILSSYSEGTPMSILETMSVGIPIISSNVGNMDELLKNYHSKLIINGFDTDEWVDKIKNFNKVKDKKPFYNKQDFSFIKSLEL